MAPLQSGKVYYDLQIERRQRVPYTTDTYETVWCRASKSSYETIEEAKREAYEQFLYSQEQVVEVIDWD